MEETPDRSGNSGMSGLKVVFFFPLLPEEDIIKVVVDFFLFKRGGEAGKKGFQPMRKKLGEKFGVVFSFAVVVTDTELRQRIEVTSVSRERDAQTNTTLGASPAGPGTRGEERTVGQGQVGEPEEGGTTLRRTHPEAIRETDGTAPGPQGVPILVGPQPQVVGHHREEIHRPRTPSTTQATPAVRAAMSRI